MTFEFYFSISRTAARILALGLVVGCGVYIAQELIDDAKKSESDFDLGL